MAGEIFAVLAGTAPIALLVTGAVLLAARLPARPRPWRSAGIAAALGSAAASLAVFGLLAFVFAGGLRAVDGVAAALAGGATSAAVTALVAAGSRLLDRNP